MRPPILFPLFAETRTLSGVGPKNQKLIARVAGTRLIDLVFDLPKGLIDRSFRPRLADAEDGRIVTATVTVLDHVPPGTRSHPWRVRCSDDSSLIDLIFFHAHADYLRRMLPRGQMRIVSGRIERFHGQLRMPHPDYILEPRNADALPLFEPIYGLTEGLAAKSLLRTVEAALKTVPELPEWDDPALVKARGWSAFHDAIGQAHAPKCDQDLDQNTPARQRLAYDEMFANQLALILIRAQTRGVKGRPLRGDGRLRKKALAALPFTLTGAQKKSLADIEHDMASPRRMLRLLQGDVGSGKTIVATLALLNAVECGAQGALMAPTEILARQHMATLLPLCEAAGARVRILTGRERGSARDEMLAELTGGGIDILIGTHALFQEDVAFRDLAFAVVDEQHRFGVHQRMTLQAKGGKEVDVLVMTATPIPRTLELTAYGDMEVSRLEERPPGRQTIETRVLGTERLDEVIAHLKRALSRGARAYWVCPLIEESEKTDLAAAQSRAVMLQESLGPDIGLIHGRMKAPDRDEAMARFKDGRLKVLVATTVIEVGVDVPEATIMVIEHAERFGLAQLHQLRGRVGRGTARSSCVLLYQVPLSEPAKARLKIMRETDDGFLIAEEDLRLRGPGEVLGVRQSGMPEFRLADLVVHADLVPVARDDAKALVARDPELKSPRGEAARIALYLFDRDEAVRYLRTG